MLGGIWHQTFKLRFDRECFLVFCMLICSFGKLYSVVILSKKASGCTGLQMKKYWWFAITVFLLTQGASYLEMKIKWVVASVYIGINYTGTNIGNNGSIPTLQKRPHCKKKGQFLLNFCAFLNEKYDFSLFLSRTASKK